MPKKIVMIGASGLIGGALCRFFVEKGDSVKGLTRSRENAARMESQDIQPVLWDGRTLIGVEKHLEGTDAVINLAGENIAAGRWTKQKKEKILKSRLDSVNQLVQALERVEDRPPVVVQASAVGFYGSRSDDELDENAALGQGFMADVVKQWEDASNALPGLGIRRILLRFGMVLARQGGALKPLIIPFRFFVGGPIGKGQQWMSWIHIHDVVRAVDFLIDSRGCTGVFNLTAPQPVRNKEFARFIGQVLHRPSFFPVPGFVLKIILGEMARELLLTSQRVLPARLSEAGFSFEYPTLEMALKDLFVHK
jgi:uncharacterized protein (TIGR01777 family)